MRGPGLRLNIDVRRMWKCPQCGKQRRVAATAVTVHCACNPSQPLMQLCEPQRRVRIEHPPLPAYLEFEEIPGEEDRLSQNESVSDQIPEVVPLLPDSALSEVSAAGTSEVVSTPADEAASSPPAQPEITDKEPGDCDAAI